MSGLCSAGSTCLPVHYTSFLVKMSNGVGNLKNNVPGEGLAEIGHLDAGAEVECGSTEQTSVIHLVEKFPSFHHWHGG